MAVVNTSTIITDGTDMPHDIPKHLEQLDKNDPARFLTQQARTSEADGIRGLLHLEKPGVVSFLAGRPNSHTFPFQSITLELKPHLSTIPNGTSQTNGNINGNGNHNTIPETIFIEGEDLDLALQYGPSAGLPKLVDLLVDFQSQVHNRQKGDWSVSIGGGVQDLMYKGFMTLLEPGDPVLLETPLYAGALPALKDLKAKFIEVDVDEEGLSAINLERVLSEWSTDQKRPRVVYSTPTGCNPSGCSASVQRKLDVLAVCKKYDVLIFEDDPYYYLTENLIPSYFELEKQVCPDGGHVLRFDSFSKLLSAGMRLGWVTGPKALLHAIDVSTSAANLHCSGVSQVIAYRLLKHWNIHGFISHCKSVASFYAQRRETFEKIVEKHIGPLGAKWVSPVAGMFLWIDLSGTGIKDTYSLIREEAYAKGFLAVPGYAFYPNGRKSSHIRVSFSQTDMADADIGFARLAEAIRAKQKQMGLV